MPTSPSHSILIIVEGVGRSRDGNTPTIVTIRDIIPKVPICESPYRILADPSGILRIYPPGKISAWLEYPHPNLPRMGIPDIPNSNSTCLADTIDSINNGSPLPIICPAKTGAQMSNSRIYLGRVAEYGGACEFASLRAVDERVLKQREEIRPDAMVGGRNDYFPDDCSCPKSPFYASARHI